MLPPTIRHLRTPTPPVWPLHFVLILSLAGAYQSVAAEEPLRPTFTLTLSDGTTVSGNVEQIGENWSIRMAGAPPRQAAGVVSLRRDKIPIPPRPRAEQIIL